MLLQDCVDSGINALPLGEQLLENIGALGREKIEALLALVLFAPFAGEESLGLKPSEKGVERAFVDFQSMLGEGFSERVAVLLATERRQDSQDEATAAKFETKIFKRVWVHRCLPGAA